MHPVFRNTLTSLFFAGLFLASEARAQPQPLHEGRFRGEYVDSTGALLDSLPMLDDSVFVTGNQYRFASIDAKGEETGLSVFDDLTLNLSLSVGEEEDRELGFPARTGSWLARFVVRVATLSVWSPNWGGNRYFFSNEILKEDLRRILSLYQNQGYFEARIVCYRARFSADRRYLAITIYIEEGQPTTLAGDPTIGVHSSYAVVDPRDDLDDARILEKLLTRKGDRLVRDNIDASKSTIQQIFGEHGYPNAEVKDVVDTATAGPRLARVHYDVYPGRYTVFGRTRVAGNYYRIQTGQAVDTTRRIVEDQVILRKIRYREGRPYSPERLSLSVGEINGLGVFRSVKPALTTRRGAVDSSLIVDRQELQALLDSLRQYRNGRLTVPRSRVDRYGVAVDTLDVSINVAERKERSIKPGIGFTTDFRDLPKSEKDKGLSTLPFFAFQISWQSKNFFGGARKLQVSGQVSKGFQKDAFFANYMQAKVTFRQPSFRIPLTRNYNSDLVLTLSGERNNTAAFDVVKYEASPTLVWQISRPLGLSLTPLSFTQQRLRSVTAAYDTTSLKNFFTTNTRVGVTINTTQDFFYPSQGFLIYFITDFAGFLLPSDLKFWRVSLDNRRYFRLSGRATLAVRARAGTIIPYRTDKGKTVIPASEQYYGGGPNSIRGWGVKELGIISETVDRLTYSGGNSILETGIEFRYNLYTERDPSEVISGMDVAGFVDMGQVWTEYSFRNKPSGLPNEPYYAVGGGIRLRTLIGPVRVDVGYKLVDPKSLTVIGTDGQPTKIDPKLAKDLSRIAIQVTLGQAF